MAVVLSVTLQAAHAQTQTGSIGGSVTNADFGGPVVGARVQIVETRAVTQTDAAGSYRFDSVPVGVYSIVVSGPDVSRGFRDQVAVQSGQIANVDFDLDTEFVTLDPFVAEPSLSLVPGGIEALNIMRDESPSIIDVVGPADLASRGVSDVGQAVASIPGASVADDSTPVIRGLPDRYVPSLVNGVRLPSSNEDKRAVELDQFPTNIVESISVSKTFTPDSQGDASGGSVDIALRSIPDEPIFNFSGGTSYNTQVTNEGDFQLYEGGGVGTFGLEADDRGPQTDRLGENWLGAVGVSPAAAPRDYKFATSVGDSLELDSGVKVGGFLSLFYERDSSFFQDGQDDSWWLRDPAVGLEPQGRGQDSASIRTALFDIVQGSRQVQWGGTASAGIEFNKDHRLGLQYLYTHSAEDRATLATDTRGKDYFFPGYDINDPGHIGNFGGSITNSQGQAVTPNDLAPVIRTHTLEYTERTTGTLQLSGDHRFRMEPIEVGEVLTFLDPELDWVASNSFASLDQPDKRLFGAEFRAASFIPGGIDPPSITPNEYFQFKPSQNVNLGNLQRIFKTIEEDSLQGAVNLKMPFDQWSGDEGYFKFGAFDDSVERDFRQDNFSNVGNQQTLSYVAGFNEFWTENWANEVHPIQEGLQDVDYDGSIDVTAWYGMLDMPLNDRFHLIGGARVENTDIGVQLTPEEQALWVPPGGTSLANLTPGDGEVDLSQRNVLPSISGIYDVTDTVSLRAAYSQTIARQTFKELTPILQQEFLGGPVFIGNPELQIAELDNYDLRVDWRPTDTTLLSASYFYKEVENPIENIQRVVGFGFTTPVNYPEGELSGVEFEARQELGEFSDALEGLTIGGNLTFIDSEVTFPDVERDLLLATDVGFDARTRDATNAPEYLYNVYLNYNIRETGTQVGLFYTVAGDTLVAGDSTSDNNYIPAIYQLEVGTLNLTFAQALTKHINLRIAAKNLTNPSITEVFRSSLIDEDVTRTTFTRGVEYSIGLSASYSF